jgi:hypothetical protein
MYPKNKHNKDNSSYYIACECACLMFAAADLQQRATFELSFAFLAKVTAHMSAMHHFNNYSYAIKYKPTFARMP